MLDMPVNYTGSPQHGRVASGLGAGPDQSKAMCLLKSWGVGRDFSSITVPHSFQIMSVNGCSKFRMRRAGKIETVFTELVQAQKWGGG